MFDIPKYRFRLNRAFLAQCNALLGKQVLFGLLAKALEFKTDLDAPIACGFGAFGFERTISALCAFIKSTFRKIACAGLVRLGFEVGHGVSQQGK